MTIRIITDGTDPLTGPLIDYLADKYGMPATEIRRLQLDSPVGGAQTLTVTLLVDPAIPARTAAVPLLNVPMRDEQPRGPGPWTEGAPHVPGCPCVHCGLTETVVMSDPAATAVLERPVSHAPTTCAAYDVDQDYQCAELIRYDADQGWYHVNDAQLGKSQHQATPGQ